MTDTIPEYLKRAAEKCGFQRESYDESRMPTSDSNIVVFPFFGDFRAQFILSTLVFPLYRKIVKGSKYFIVCSWPGMKDMWPDVDEFWSVKDTSILRQLASSSLGFGNEEAATLNFWIPLNRHFREVIDVKDLQKYCNFGLTDQFMIDFKTIRRHLPVIPSSGVLGLEFNRTLANRPGYKICIFPTTRARVLRNGKFVNVIIPIGFWNHLIDALVIRGYTPIVIQNYWTYDLPNNEKCLYVREGDFSKVLASMRCSDCVLDIFGDVCRFAVMSRSPYIACVERSKYMDTKEFELDDLCCHRDLPKKYIFSFVNAVELESHWNIAILEPVLAKIDSFVPNINRDKIPPGSLIDEEISYKSVRARKVKKMGVKFIKVEKLF